MELRHDIDSPVQSWHKRMDSSVKLEIRSQYDSYSSASEKGLNDCCCLFMCQSILCPTSFHYCVQFHQLLLQNQFFIHLSFLFHLLKHSSLNPSFCNLLNFNCSPIHDVFDLRWAVFTWNNSVLIWLFDWLFLFFVEFRFWRLLFLDFTWIETD